MVADHVQRSQLATFAGPPAPSPRQNETSVLMRAPARRPPGRVAGTRPVRTATLSAAAAWCLTALAMVIAQLASARPSGDNVARGVRLLAHAAGHAVAIRQALGAWPLVIDVLVGTAAAISLLALRVVLRPASRPGAEPGGGLAQARAIVAEHAEDSLAPFILRPDKRFEFAAGAVVAYRQIGRTAVVSGDPVGPEGSAPAAVGHLLAVAHRRGCRVAVYGSSGRHLDAYRALGMRAICVGEEAIVDPAGFSLEGRAVRKLRQSVQRLTRRGWTITALDGRDVSDVLEAEIEAVETAWRAVQGRMLGFAMGMGEFETGIAAADLYLIARSPEGDLRAVMRFISHCGRLSLDTMRRIGETPNGLNEALVCLALEIARERGVREVSLNYAGLAHLVRTGPSGGPVKRTITRLAIDQLGRRFQMERLVRFNEKFSPHWQPRYLVYESAVALPGAVLRVLQAEGYLRHGERGRRRRVPAAEGLCGPAGDQPQAGR